MNAEQLIQGAGVKQGMRKRISNPGIMVRNMTPNNCLKTEILKINSQVGGGNYDYYSLSQI
ncbi:hypothetical protein ACFLUU_03450 [Chloroflexota bacterium]